VRFGAHPEIWLAVLLCRNTHN